MSGAGLRERTCGKALSDMLTLKPYWGKPAVRNFRGGDGNVGIIRSPVRAIVLLDLGLMRGVGDYCDGTSSRQSEITTSELLSPRFIWRLTPFTTRRPR